MSATPLRLCQDIAFAVFGFIPAACFGLGLLFDPPAIAQSNAGVAAMVPFDAAPPPARRCTCRDIDDLVDNMHGGAASATHFRDLQRRLNDRENQGLSLTDSQTEWLAAEAAFTIPPRDKGAGGERSATTPTGAKTDGVTCRSVISRSSLTRSCDGFIRALWEHERVHREICNARTKAGKTAFDYPGSYHAAEEATAYEASNVILRAEIERVLEESRLTVRATIKLSTITPMSYADSKFVIDLQPQGASGDGVVEFVDLTGKGQTQFTSLRHWDCSAKPVNQALTLSVRTVDMQNFTVLYQPGAPQTTRYICTSPPPPHSVNVPLFQVFANRWVQPIRMQRPFPFSALVTMGGSRAEGFPGLPPGISLPNMGPVTLPEIAPMSAVAGFPNLTPSEMDFGFDTMVTLSCP